jgi:hypothetical protein
MPQMPITPVTLSDGNHVFMPTPGMSQADISKHVQQAESQLFDMYSAKAKETGQPYLPTYKGVPGKKIYSETNEYPANAMGGNSAWFDQNLGLNKVNRFFSNLNQSTGGYLKPAAEGAGRVYSEATEWPADLAVGAYNVGRHALGSTDPSGDLSSPSENFRQTYGIPEMAADAPAWQRWGEGGLAVAASGLNPAAIARLGVPRLLAGVARRTAGGALATATGEKGAEIGGDIGDLVNQRELGTFVGGLAGGATPSALKIGAERGIVAPLTRHPNAPEIYTSAHAITPEGQPPQDPSFRTLANPVGQRIASTLGALPILGTPIERANEATSNLIQGARDRVATEMAGPRGLPYEGASPESIGAEYVRGAQQASAGGAGALGTPSAPRPDLRMQRDEAFAPVNQAMAGGTVDVQPVVQSVERSLQQRPTTPDNEAAIRALVGQLTARSPGGPQFIGPVDPAYASRPMPAPWSLVKDFRTGIRQDIGEGPISVPANRVADIKGDTTTAMRDAVTQTMGSPAPFDRPNEMLASRIGPMLAHAYQVGGTPLGPGQFRDPMAEGPAYRRLMGNMQSPSALEPLTVPANFPAESWRNISGQVISRLGDAGQGAFRPEHFHRDWNKIGPGVQDLLTQTPQGGVSPGRQALDNAATVASNYSTPLARHGLTGALGAAYSVHAVLDALKKIGLGAAGSALGGRAIANYMESPGLKAAMGRASVAPELARMLYEKMAAGTLAANRAVQNPQ